MTSYYLGIDVGSVSTNIALLDEKGKMREKIYLRTQGKPIDAIREGLTQLKGMIPNTIEIKGLGTTGSGRQLAAAVLGADIVKNEITAQGVAAMAQIDDVRTVIEIGGQDSKIIIIRDGVIVDFAMNTVCAAGTGSFLDRQAARLGIGIEEFGHYALRSDNPIRIAGRCAVFAESDMIHKQQMGCNQDDIIYGLCEALVRNFLINVAKGKVIEDNIVFQGGVAANVGIHRSFENALNKKIYVPENYDVMGAIGAAILARDYIGDKGITRFYGLDNINKKFEATGIECNGCPNLCEIIEIRMDEKVIARWGDRCGKWDIPAFQNEEITQTGVV